MASEQLTSRGIAALRAGDRVMARRLLGAALRANPQDLQAWLWLSGALQEPEAQRYCLQRVLALKPEHQAARRGLQALDALQGQAAPAQQHAQPAHISPAATPVPLVQTKPAPSITSSVAAQALTITATPAPAEAPRQLVALASAPTAPLPNTATAPAKPAPASLVLNDSYVNPWLALWHQPRRAMRSAIAMRSPGETWLLAALAGVSGYLAAMAWSDLGTNLGSREVLGVAMVIGPLIGMVSLHLVGVLLRTGGWLLGGRAAAGRVRAALAWATAPLIFGLPLWLLQILFWPEATFQRPAYPFERLVINGANLIHLSLWLWVAWLSLVGLAEAQLTGMPRALAAWLAAIGVVVVAFALLFGGAALIIDLRGG